MRRAIMWVLGCAFIGFAAPAGDAREVVEIVLHTQYFSEPATVRFLVAVEPDEANRMLRVEADGRDLFRSSEVMLDGADERRLHSFEFKNLPAGEYTLRAAVASSDAVLGLDTRELMVTGIGLR